VKKRPSEPRTILTIGHSTKTVSEFIGILNSYKINKVVDIRTIPKSRHNPQFNNDALGESLQAAGIGYRHLKGLGGLRHARRDSPNKAWRNASFRGFADYMQTGEFAESLEELMETASKQTTVIMCAEAVPWRCHRSLIGDALLVRGFQVKHIMGPDSVRDHALTPWAKVEGEKITYPPATASPEPSD
jgi:uncharacterized protein (DUF488 family)